ncbi:MATE family efflux transporter [Clostridium senegalense]|uniref:MATE family efflux transporter n=1 Tax=Clostridium senegalense TaxID=1465809 RepID=UPI0002897D4F|nr:MATE family efflux transporter [Clostridium senegalense]
MEKGVLRDKRFYKKMFAIAIPVMIQNLISSSLNMVDTIMIGKLGETQIAAVGLANQFYFLFSLFIFGVNSGCSIFTAQFWGKNDKSNIRKILGICLILGCAGGLIFNILAFFSPELVMRFFTKDPLVIKLGADYLKIVGWSYVITAISYAFAFSCRGIGQAKLPMITSAIALLCNTVFNYILIFGALGFPTLGVEGAAIATLIARIMEMALIIIVIYKRKSPLVGRLKEFFDFNKKFFLGVVKTMYPVVINEICWSLGMTMYSVIYARIGTEAVATYQIASTIQNIFIVAGFGLANACAVMIGNEIGAGREENAQIYGNRFVKITFIIGCITGTLLFLATTPIVEMYNVSPQVLHDTKIILRVFSFITPFRMLTSIFIVGILRSGGDVKYSFVLEMSGVWIVGIPIAIICAHVLKLPIYLVVSVVYIQELLKVMLAFPRFKSKKWIRNLVSDM